MLWPMLLRIPCVLVWTKGELAYSISDVGRGADVSNLNSLLAELQNASKKVLQMFAPRSSISTSLHNTFRYFTSSGIVSGVLVSLVTAHIRGPCTIDCSHAETFTTLNKIPLLNRYRQLHNSGKGEMDRESRMSSCEDGKYYEPLLASDDIELEDEDKFEAVKPSKGNTRQFSLSEYVAFFTIGLSMMWTWSMILQAVPYFQRRFATNATIHRYFQASYLLFFATTMCLTTIILSRQQEQPMYTRRLKGALCAYVAVAALLMLSALDTFNVRAELYYPFTLVMVVITGIANGLSQNAAFAFAAGFGRTEYAPAVMTGEALAGLLPSTIEIISALAFPAAYFDADVTGNPQMSALTIGYFLSALLVGLASLGGLGYLVPRSGARPVINSYLMNSSWARWSSTLKWPALANFSCLCISSVSSVFITKVTSVVPRDSAPVLLRPEAFIPLAIVLWNIGDFFGSLIAIASRFLLKRPLLIFILSLARVGFIPLYLLCNINGRGSFAGDWFYLFCVQFLFGVTHGWLSGASMMGVPEWVAEKDREEAGAFMGTMLVAGLVAGSILGLIVARV